MSICSRNRSSWALGQRVDALLLDRVLGREHMEGLRQLAVLAGDGDLALLHRLQQRRLGARAGPVDLVGHQQLGEHRALDEAEGARPVRPLLQHLGAEDVGGHQVRGELNPVGVQPQHGAQGVNQPGLGQPRHPDHQRVAAGQNRRQRQVYHLGLADDAPGNLRLHAPQRLSGLLDLLNRVARFFWHGVQCPFWVSILILFHIPCSRQNPKILW